MRKLIRMLHSEGYKKCAVRNAALEVCGVKQSPMDIVLRVASLAHFAFEMDVVYKPVKATDGKSEFLVELR